MVLVDQDKPQTWTSPLGQGYWNNRTGYLNKKQNKTKTSYLNSKDWKRIKVSVVKGTLVRR